VMEKILSIPSDPEDTSKPKTAARAAVFSFYHVQGEQRWR
jgi:hypothetical protein